MADKDKVELYCTNCGSGMLKIEWWKGEKEREWYIEVTCLNCGLVSRMRLDVVKEGLDIDEALRDLCRRLKGCDGLMADRDITSKNKGKNEIEGYS